MGSKKYLSYQAQKLVDWLTAGFAVVFVALAVSHWGKLAAWEAQVFSEGKKYHPVHLAVFVFIASVIAGDAAASGVALLYDFVTRQGKFDPEIRRVAKQKGNLGFAAGEGQEPHPLGSPEALGPVLFSHQFPKSARRVFLWVFAVVLLLPSIPLAFAGLGDFPMNVIGPMAAVALLFCSYGLVRAKPVAKTLRVRRDGLEWTAGKEARACRWRDIIAVREGITDFPKEKQRLHTCEIKTSDGRKMLFSNLEPITAATFAPTVDTIHAQTSVLLLARCAGLHRSGLPVDFGPVSLDAERLYFGVRSIARSEVADVKVESGQVAIYRSGEKQVPFAAFGWDALWNPWVLIPLLRGE